MIESEFELTKQSFNAHHLLSNYAYYGYRNGLKVVDIIPINKTHLFLTIHNQFLQRIRARLAEVGLRPDNSPTHGLVLSELIFYRENLKYINVLPEDSLKDSALAVIWS